MKVEPNCWYSSLTRRMSSNKTRYNVKTKLFYIDLFTFNVQSLILSCIYKLSVRFSFHEVEYLKQKAKTKTKINQQTKYLKHVKILFQSLLDYNIFYHQ